MNNPLQQLGNIPVTASVLESLFPHIRGGSQKLRLLERDKQIIRLKKGLYVCSPEITGKTLSTELIANHLYAPSYVSMSSALRYYGLIPEEVYTKQSMTLKYAKNFDTGYAFVMATPEKALCDLIANSSKVNLRYLKDAEIYLEEDIRMEREDFMQMDARLFEEYIKVGKKADSIRTLLKLLKK